MNSIRTRAALNLIKREQFPEAWEIVSDVLNGTPDDPMALYLCGCILRGQHHIGMALQMFRRALAFERKQANIWMHYGACLHDTHQYSDAREAFLFVHKALPKDPMPLANIAASYVQEGKPAEALEWARKSLAIDPANTVANVAMGYSCLSLGKWEEGWKYSDYLYGNVLRTRIYNPKEREEPTWDGSKGKTVVVQADQGMGDIIMFSQMLPQMMADCKRVILEIPPRLTNLLRRNFPGLVVQETLKDDEISWPLEYQIDAHIHISGVGRFYRRQDSDFPRRTYLTADESKRGKWRAWLERFPRPWVGIAWRGGISRTNEQGRSIPLAEWKPILEQEGTFVSLAYQNVGLEVATWNIGNRTQVLVPDIDNTQDYDEWVALIAELDCVICVPTAARHVCGAIGKRCYSLVSASPVWSSQLERNGMIWYPENTIVNYRRGHKEPDWQRVIKQVAQDYSTFMVPRVKAA